VSSNDTFMLACYGVDFFEINSTRYAADTWHAQQWPNGTHLTIYVELSRRSPVTIGQLPEFSWRCAIQGEDDVPRVAISTTSSVVLPSCYEGQLASPYGSLPVVLVHERPQSLSLAFDSETSTELALSLLSSSNTNNNNKALHSQARFDGAYPSALHFEVRNTTATDSVLSCTSEWPLVLEWEQELDESQAADHNNPENTSEQQQQEEQQQRRSSKTSVSLRFALPQIPENSSIALTYRDFDDSVRQALAYPPTQDCVDAEHGCPVILVFASHVEFDSLLSAFERRADAWMLIPQSRRGSGATQSFSGLIDVESATAALEALARMSARTPLRRADTHRVIVLPYEDRGICQIAPL